MKIPVYDTSSVTDLPVNHSGLFNAMIYPFTRMVIYGSIWYQGEANTGYNVDQYVCTFSKMIQYWRQTWNERTNGITDLQFPFGFVQVRFIQNY
jgi:sialate O-acetylesterase